MQIRSWRIGALFLIVLCLAQPTGFVAQAHAKKSEANKAEPIVSGGPHLRLLPMMAPYHSSAGVVYQPLMIDVEVAGGGSGDPKLDTKGDLKDRKSTRLNSSHLVISYAVFCLKKKT